MHKTFTEKHTHNPTKKKKKTNQTHTNQQTNV